MDEAFYNAAEMASEEICDCESPSECMANVIERFTDYKDSKEFRDEVLRRVMECRKQKDAQRKYDEHFDEAVDAVAKDLCKKGAPEKNFYETTAELYPTVERPGAPETASDHVTPRPPRVSNEPETTVEAVAPSSPTARSA